MNDKLKLCPFCGSEARIEEIRTFARIVYSVSCIDIDRTCPMYYLKTRYFGTKKQAIEAWNRRVNENERV